MLQRILAGGVAGAVATVPQSAVVWGLRAAGVYRRRPAPEVVTEGVTDSVVGLENVPSGWLTPIKWAGHFGYGAGAGAAYGASTAALPATPLTGLGAGLLVWLVSYRGWIPKVGIMPPAERDERGRQLAMVLAHVVFGLTLGALVQRLAPRD